jgi:uncharacterized membrane protein YphA (DoxX/SURF4 family)
MKNLLNLSTTVTVNRITLGLFFFLSGINNYLHFNGADGFYQTVLTQKLRIIGNGIPPGWEGIGPLPGLIAIPYAWLLPLAEIVLGALFAFNYWVRWTGLLLLLLTFSIVLAFGAIPTGSFFTNASPSFNTSIFLMTLIWMCMAYDAYEQKMSRRRTQAMTDYSVNTAEDK